MNLTPTKLLFHVVNLLNLLFMMLIVKIVWLVLKSWMKMVVNFMFPVSLNQSMLVKMMKTLMMMNMTMKMVLYEYLTTILGLVLFFIFKLNIYKMVKGIYYLFSPFNSLIRKMIRNVFFFSFGKKKKSEIWIRTQYAFYKLLNASEAYVPYFMPV